jgi:hypothetical protein
MSMEVNIGCGMAGVSVLDGNSVPIVTFSNVGIVGGFEFCESHAFGPGFVSSPGADFN